MQVNGSVVDRQQVNHPTELYQIYRNHWSTCQGGHVVEKKIS